MSAAITATVMDLRAAAIMAPYDDHPMPDDTARYYAAMAEARHWRVYAEMIREALRQEEIDRCAAF